jgi:hypothetical protein
MIRKIEEYKINAALKGILFSVLFVIFFVFTGCSNPLSEIIDKDLEELFDEIQPVISVFTLTSEEIATSRDITFTLEGIDDVSDSIEWLINETETKPSPDAGGWLSELPTTYELSDGDGDKTVYAWAKDEAGNVSDFLSFTLILYTAGPSTTFTLTSSTPTGNPAITFDLTGDDEVTEWYISEDEEDPGGDGWVGTAPSEYEFSAIQGTHILYAWAKNEGGFLSVRKSIQIEISVEAPTTSIPDSTLITGHETIVLTFSETMDNTIASFGGTIGTAAGTWDENTYPDDTLTIEHTTLWNTGSERTLTIDCSNQYGVPIITFNLSYDVFHGTCIDDDSTVTEKDGSAKKPYDTIQAGIDQADTLYITPVNGIDTAEVRVSGGTYSAACAVSPTPIYIADIKEGISLYGGYNVDFTSRNTITNTSTIIDSSTNATNSNASNPVRAVNCDSSAITAMTRIDGFTITPGEQGADGNIHCSIALINGASPTIYDVSITGRGITERSNTTYGMFLSSSSAIIQNCSIQPTATDYSYAVYTINGASTPTIKECTINGGEAKYTVGLRLMTGVDATITDNEINGGDWETTLPGIGWGIYLSSCSPIITDNRFTIHTVFHDETVAIRESNDSSDPASVRRNDFDYDGIWYKDESAGSIITSSNYDTDTISTDEGAGLLFNTTWDNYSTIMDLP